MKILGAQISHKSHSIFLHTPTKMTRQNTYFVHTDVVSESKLQNPTIVYHKLPFGLAVDNNLASM